MNVNREKKTSVYNILVIYMYIWYIYIYIYIIVQNYRNKTLGEYTQKCFKVVAIHCRYILFGLQVCSRNTSRVITLWVLVYWHYIVFPFILHASYTFDTIAVQRWWCINGKASLLFLRVNVRINVISHHHAPKWFLYFWSSPF